MIITASKLCNFVLESQITGEASLLTDALGVLQACQDAAPSAGMWQQFIVTVSTFSVLPSVLLHGSHCPATGFPGCKQHSDANNQQTINTSNNVKNPGFHILTTLCFSQILPHSEDMCSRLCVVLTVFSNLFSFNHGGVVQLT